MPVPPPLLLLLLPEAAVVVVVLVVNVGGGFRGSLPIVVTVVGETLSSPTVTHHYHWRRGSLTSFQG